MSLKTEPNDGLIKTPDFYGYGATTANFGYGASAYPYGLGGPTGSSNGSLSDQWNYHYQVHVLIRKFDNQIYFVIKFFYNLTKKKLKIIIIKCSMSTEYTDYHFNFRFTKLITHFGPLTKIFVVQCPQKLIFNEISINSSFGYVPVS